MANLNEDDERVAALIAKVWRAATRRGHFAVVAAKIESDRREAERVEALGPARLRRGWPRRSKRTGDDLADFLEIRKNFDEGEDANFLEKRKKSKRPKKSKRLKKPKRRKASRAPGKPRERVEPPAAIDVSPTVELDARLPFPLPHRIAELVPGYPGKRRVNVYGRHGASRNLGVVETLVLNMVPGEVYTFDRIARFFGRRFLAEGESFKWSRRRGVTFDQAAASRLFCILLKMKIAGMIHYPPDGPSYRKPYHLTARGVLLRQLIADNPTWRFLSESVLEKHMRAYGSVDGLILWTHKARPKWKSAPFDPGALRLMGYES